jgi:hypothetical protein
LQVAGRILPMEESGQWSVVRKRLAAINEWKAALPYQRQGVEGTSAHWCPMRNGGMGICWTV